MRNPFGAYMLGPMAMVMLPSSAYGDSPVAAPTVMSGGWPVVSPGAMDGGWPVASPVAMRGGGRAAVGDWELCSSSDQCDNGCCSKMYSDDGQYKCTPLDEGFVPEHNGCIGGSPAAPPTSAVEAPPVTGDSVAWPNNGNGLMLEILNACNDDWQVPLAEALKNWDNGFPIDSLSFIVTPINYESECSFVEGKYKVCNGNYGDTGWLGVNTLLFSGATIMSSNAKLNDYYFANVGDDDKQFTVCHELGHGFGLPHWDEDFTNQVSDPYMNSVCARSVTIVRKIQ